MKVLLTRNLHEFAINDLKKRFKVEIYRGKIPIPKKELIRKIKDKDGLLCYPYDRIDSEIIDSAKNLKVISTFSVGYDQVDFRYAKKKGIILTYTPEVLTKATADLTMSLILSLLRRATEGDRMIRNHQWKKILGPSEFLGTDFYGKTLGILGLGRIGKAVARRALGFEAKIIYNNSHRLNEKTEKKIGVKYVSLQDLFKQSDILTIHTPYTKTTNGLVDLGLMKKMKQSAVIINTSRGKIIKERDLIYALKKKIIAGAALDVFNSEPILNSNPLLKMENVVLTPHIGSSSVETRNEMVKLAVENLIFALTGKTPKFFVNVP